MNVIFLGPPGSGKGTQAKRLAKEFEMTHVSTGDVFRENIQKGTELGTEIKSYVDTGKLVPDELVSKVVFDAIGKPPLSQNFLLDGYPRTIEQAKALDKFVGSKQIIVDAVFFFDADSAELVKRLSARRQCPSCKEVFNLVTRTPKQEGVCDKCGGKLDHRKDDQPEVVQERLHIYDVQTKPILDFYKGRPNFVSVKAVQEVDGVYQELAGPLNKFRKSGALK